MVSSVGLRFLILTMPSDTLPFLLRILPLPTDSPVRAIVQVVIILLELFCSSRNEPGCKSAL